VAPQLPEIRPPQLPRIEEVLGFPVPRLSAVARFLAFPATLAEDLFESAVRSVTGAELPPGPVKTTLSLMEGFETTVQTTAPQLPGLPGAPAPSTTPSVPPAPSAGQAQQKPPTARRIDVEVF